MSEKHSVPAYAPRRLGGVRLARRRALPAVSWGALVLSIGLVSVDASASQAYYDALVPTGTCQDCTLCHNVSPGALENLALDKPFAFNMYSKRYVGGLPPPELDSDMDGYTDLAELEDFGDPNDPMVGPGEGECPNQPEYGCLTMAHHASRGSSVSTWPLLALLGALVLRRRNR